MKRSKLSIILAATFSLLVTNLAYAGNWQCTASNEEDSRACDPQVVALPPLPTPGSNEHFFVYYWPSSVRICEEVVNRLGELGRTGRCYVDVYALKNNNSREFLVSESFPTQGEVTIMGFERVQTICEVQRPRYELEFDGNLDQCRACTWTGRTVLGSITGDFNCKRGEGYCRDVINGTIPCVKEVAKVQTEVRDITGKSEACFRYSMLSGYETMDCNVEDQTAVGLLAVDAAKSVR